jgi:hypothetical protein
MRLPQAASVRQSIRSTFPYLLHRVLCSGTLETNYPFQLCPDSKFAQFAFQFGTIPNLRCGLYLSPRLRASVRRHPWVPSPMFPKIIQFLLDSMLTQ